MLLTIEVVHKFELPPGLCSAVSLEAFKALESKMAKTKDELDQLKAETDAAVARIAEDTAAFNTSMAIRASSCCILGLIPPSSSPSPRPAPGSAASPRGCAGP